MAIPFQKKVLILGTGPLALKLIAAIEARPHCGYAIVGVVNGAGSYDDLGRVIQDVRPDRIIVAPADSRRLPLRALFEARLHGVLIEEGVETYERLTGKLAIESFTPGRFIFLKDFRKPSIQMALRRAISLVLASIGLALSAPLMAVIALAIKLDSPGPVFFIQERVGMGGRPFRLVKFRTMYPTRERRSEWAQDNGDRITPVGKRLRKFRLDELPQFLNVLRGEMDLVGPRPHPVSNHELFILVLRNAPDCGEAIPYYALRSMIRPGITGWAQVRYRYANDLEEEIEKMKYDLYYLKHMSLRLDLRILIETVGIALLGRGSDTTRVLDPTPRESKPGTVLVGENRLTRSSMAS